MAKSLTLYTCMTRSGTWAGYDHPPSGLHGFTAHSRVEGKEKHLKTVFPCISTRFLNEIFDGDLLVPSFFPAAAVPIPVLLICYRCEKIPVKWACGLVKFLLEVSDDILDPLLDLSLHQFSRLFNHEHQKEHRLFKLREFIGTRRLNLQGTVVEEGLRRAAVL